MLYRGMKRIHNIVLGNYFVVGETARDNKNKMFSEYGLGTQKDGRTSNAIF